MNRPPMSRPDKPVVDESNVLYEGQSDRYLLHRPSLLRAALASRSIQLGAAALATFAACNVATYEVLAFGDAHSWEAPVHDLKNFENTVGKIAGAVISIGEHL